MNQEQIHSVHQNIALTLLCAGLVLASGDLGLMGLVGGGGGNHLFVHMCRPCCDGRHIPIPFQSPAN